MRSVLRTLLAALAVALVLHSEQAAALEVFANTGPGNTGLNISGGTPDQYSLAQGFKAGGTAYQLQSIQMAFNFTNPALIGNKTPTDYLQISLYTSTGTTLKTPNTLIGSFSSTPVETFGYNAQKLYTFNYSGTQTLAANTEYWVIVTSNRTVTTASFNWGFGDGTVPNDQDQPQARNSSGYTYVGTVGQQTQNGTWLDYNVPGPTPPRNMASGLRFGVIVVPEPSTYALGIIGTLVMGAVARRKSRKPVSA